jgi:hypothetical protein
MADRKQSPLAARAAHPAWGGAGTATAEPEVPVGPVAPKTATTRTRTAREPVAPAQASGEEGAGRRRKRQPQPLKPTDLVSFNCKMTVVCRRTVGTYAALHDVDKQDVVERALVEFFIRRGVPPEDIPMRPGAPDLP